MQMTRSQLPVFLTKDPQYDFHSSALPRPALLLSQTRTLEKGVLSSSIANTQINNRFPVNVLGVRDDSDPAGRGGSAKVRREEEGVCCGWYSCRQVSGQQQQQQ